MKFRKRHVGILFTVVLGYFLVYYALHSVEIYIPASTPNADKNAIVIVIDAGHGGLDSGCVSVNGAEEKNINLSILLKVQDMCEAFGYTVVVTRDTDISIHDEGVTGTGNQKRSDMDNRLEIFNKYENAVAISIHQNQFTQSQYSGAQMFYSRNNPLNEKFARIMQDEFVTQLQPDNTRETKPCGKELFLCYYSNCPTLMIECGFLSNPDEAALLESEEYQSKVAFTIFGGLNKFIIENM